MRFSNPLWDVCQGFKLLKCKFQTIHHFAISKKKNELSETLKCYFSYRPKGIQTFPTFRKMFLKMLSFDLFGLLMWISFENLTLSFHKSINNKIRNICEHEKYKYHDFDFQS